MRIVICIALLCVWGPFVLADTTGNELVNRYLAIQIDQDNNDAARIRYLVSLNRDEFGEFIRAVGRDRASLGSDEAASMVMTVFAKAYLVGPGKGDSIKQIMQHVADRSFPPEWRAALLDCTKFDRRALSSDDVRTICNGLMSRLEDANEDIWMRRLVARRIFGITNSQQERLVTTEPKLKNALASLDTETLERMATNGEGGEPVEIAITVVRCKVELINCLQRMSQGETDRNLRAFAVNTLERQATSSSAATKPMEEK